MADQFEIYNGFNIRAFESSPAKWTAEIRKVDGSQIQRLLPELGEDVLECLTTDPETTTAEAAIKLAKEAIDGGGMRQAFKALRRGTGRSYRRSDVVA